VVCNEKELENRALGRKMLIESRKLGYLTCYESAHVEVL
jgi:hypothetical protein